MDAAQKTRLRIRFTKCGDLRWISHRDLARLWERLLRRAGLELAFSQGFHPKPKISFPSALALGIEALDEIVELEIVGEFEIGDVERRIAEQTPTGMQLLEVVSRAEGAGKAKVLGASYRVALPEDAVAPTQTRIAAILVQPEVSLERDGKTISCSTSHPQFALAVEDGYLTFSLPNEAQGAIRPNELLVYVGLPELLESGALLQRVGVHLMVKEEVK